MSNGQKVIKYFAYGLAIYIICLIVYSFGYLFNIMTGLFSNRVDNNITENTKVIYNDKDMFNELDIDIRYANVLIKLSDTFRVDTNNNYIKYKIDSNKLSIVEEKHSYYKSRYESILKIYLPNMLLDKVKIENGFGKLNIDGLNTNKLSLVLGAGRTSLSNIIINDKTNIECGAGNLDISNSELNNFDLSMGIGNTLINAKIKGNSEIEAGVGNIDIKLVDGIDNYTFDIDKGLGNITIDSVKQKDDTKYGNGNNYIEIDGGIGNININ